MNTKQILLSEFLDSLYYYANKDFNGDYVTHEFERVDSQHGLLDVFWGDGGSSDFHITLNCTYYTLDDAFGITEVIKGFEVLRVEQGDGYDNQVLNVVGITESNLTPVLEIYFDKYTDRNTGKHNNVSFDLDIEVNTDFK